MSSFAQIKARVESYLIDVPVKTGSEVGNWVNRAVRVAQDLHNFRLAEATASFTTVTGTRLLGAKPADWKEARSAPWVLEGDSGTKEIGWITDSDAIRDYSESALDIGRPKFLLETATGFDVYPFPDGTSLWPDGEYRIRIPYWSRMPDLSADTDTNWFTDNAEDYLVFFATAEGLIFNRDEDRAAVYVGKADQELSRLVRVDKRSRLPRRITLRPMRDVHGSSRQGRM